MKTKTQVKSARRVSRHNRIRARVSGTAEKPRLAIYKSNSAIYAQLIDDAKGYTLAAADTRKLDGNLSESAKALGTKLAELAKALKIDTVVFDRGGFPYQGAIALVADSAREGGLKF